MKTKKPLFRALLLLALAACNKDQAPASPSVMAPAPEAQAEMDDAKRDKDSFGERGGGKMKKEMAPRRAMKSANLAGPGAVGGMAAADMEDAAAAEPKMLEENSEGLKGGGGASAETAPTRAWFPESFLFEPLVKTDAAGAASIMVRVPDRLTTWRVLALAHSREGAQSGAVTSFLGTLPVYLDPVVPPFLATGDEVELPIQMVNTTDKRIERQIVVEGSGAARVMGTGMVTLAPESSIVRYAKVIAMRPGQVKLKASLAGEDAIEKTFAVVPTGKPMTDEIGGTLASPRTPSIELPNDTEAEGATVRLTVFPGALALLRSELQSAVGRGGMAEDAYLLLLAGQAKGLLEKLGGDVDPESLRKLSLTAAQRALRYNRGSSPEAAVLFAEGALAHAESNPVMGRLGERLAATAASAQRPDGTFLSQSGWTVQRLLVATADGVHAVAAGEASGEAGKNRAARARLLAGGAVERMIARVEDPYTAAALLAAGVVEGSLADTLRQRVRDAITGYGEGAKALLVPSEVVRADGTSPSTYEATALAVLALEKDPAAAAVLPDLGATLLSGYRPAYGWGDGRSNLVALQAVLHLFKDPLPSKVQISLSRDGRVLSEGTLEGARLKEVLVLDAELHGPAGPHQYKIEAVPAVPGLGYTLQHRYFVPWKDEEEAAGLDLTVDVSKAATVGRPADVVVRAIAPGGAALQVVIALPAGVQPDKPSLEALVQSGVISSFETRDGYVELQAPERAQGQSFSARLRVVPTIAGKLHTSASSVALSDRPGEPHYVPPSVWTVANR